MKTLIATFLMLCNISLQAQTHTDQNGVKTSVIGRFAASATQAKRYEIAEVGYNSYHWQEGSVIIVELFQYYYGTGYEKYSVEIGYMQGGQGAPEVKLVDSQGKYHYAKITLGTPYDLSTYRGDKINKAIPIYLDVRHYANYRVKLTYMQNSVNGVTTSNQIKINEAPTPINISDFVVPTNMASDYRNLAIKGNGNHYIENGKLGIGTTNPTEMLEVAGTIRAREVKVEVNAGADYVFDREYNLLTLDQVEAHIREYKHLPDIPSEKQMQEEGLSINEFQIKLLQKIEELTLYVIQQQKEIEELKKQYQN